MRRGIFLSLSRAVSLEKDTKYDSISLFFSFFLAFVFVHLKDNTSGIDMGQNGSECVRMSQNGSEWIPQRPSASLSVVPALSNKSVSLKE